MKTSYKSSIQLFFAFASIFPLYIFSTTLYKYALNVPFHDDYDAILKYLITWKNFDVTNKIQSLLQQHNEHRIVSSRIIYASYFEIFGTVNFKHLLLLGNLQLLSIAILVVLMFIKQLKHIYGIFVFVVSLCLFDLSSYQNSIWTMASIANYGVILLFLLSLYFYKKSNLVFTLLAFLFQVVCIISNGNGVFAGFSIILFNLLNREKIKAIVSIAATIIGTYFYFNEYHSLNNTLQEINPIGIIAFIIKFFGSHFCYNSIIRVIITAGSFLIISKWLFFPINKNTIERFYKNAAVVSILCFIVSTVVITAIFRSKGINGAGSYSSRYLIYAHLYTIIIFIITTVLSKNKRYEMIISFLWTAILLTSFFINLDFGISNLESFREYHIENKYAFPGNPDHAREIAIESCREGIYCR